jgi:hypothetical protein
MGVDVIDPADRDHVVFETRAEVELGQFDLLAMDVIHTADVRAVGADDFEAFAQEGEVYHGSVLIHREQENRPASRRVA